MKNINIFVLLEKISSVIIINNYLMLLFFLVVIIVFGVSICDI